MVFRCFYSPTVGHKGLLGSPERPCSLHIGFLNVSSMCSLAYRCSLITTNQFHILVYTYIGFPLASEHFSKPDLVYQLILLQIFFFQSSLVKLEAVCWPACARNCVPHSLVRALITEAHWYLLCHFKSLCKHTGAVRNAKGLIARRCLF